MINYSTPLVHSFLYTMADSDTKGPVKYKEALSVIKKIHGQSCELLDFEVEKGTESVQGFLSNILRVAARVQVDALQKSTKFIVKRLPALLSQQEYANELGVFEHEIDFFEHCAPILWEQCPDLPAVKCFGTNLEESIIYMEDLKELGYVAVVHNLADLKDNILTMDHVKLAVKALAKFHSASYGIDWLQKYPRIFREDIIFERNEGLFFKKKIKKSAESNLLPVVKIMYEGKEIYIKSIEWLTASDNCFQKMTNLHKASDPDEVNVLCHGDCWANNMMFKIDPDTGKPMDVKLIDFQVVRYAPANVDLLSFLYTCNTYDFRKKHEREILEYYVAAFNESCVNLGKDFVLEWDKFYEKYDKARFFGVQLAAMLRPMVHLRGLLPSENDALTDEQVSNLFEGGSGPNAAIEEYNTNEAFRNEIVLVAEEVKETYEKMFI